MRLAGAVGLAHGLSLVRPLFKVDTTALMGSDWGALAKVLVMSSVESGEPVVMDTLLAWVARVSGLRTRAEMVWPLRRASEMMAVPVRPLAPRSRIRMVNNER